MTHRVYVILRNSPLGKFEELEAWIQDHMPETMIVLQDDGVDREETLLNAIARFGSEKFHLCIALQAHMIFENKDDFVLFKLTWL